VLRHIVDVARKEIFSHLYSVRFIFTMDLVCLLFLGSAFMMLSDYRNRRADFEAKRRVHEERILDVLNNPDPREQFRDLFWRGGISYDRPPAEMSVFVRGLDLRLPVTFTASAWEAKHSSGERYRNPLLKLYAAPDFSYLVNIILSLLALLFVFDSVSGEKEDGTLRLVLSYPVSKAAVLLGKWTGGFVTLMGPFLLGVLFWMIVTVTSGAIDFGWENMVRFAGVVAASAVYLAVFFSLGMFVSTVTYRSNTSLLVCFFIWVVWIVVIPNAAPIAAKVICPVPSRREIEKLKEEIDRRTRLRIKEARREILSYSDELEKKREEIRAQGEYQKYAVERFYAKRVKRQDAVAGFLARISPSGSYVFAVTALAGTGVRAYHAVFRMFEKFEADVRRLLSRLGRRWRRLEPGWLTRETIPRFHPLALPVDKALDEAMFDMLLLAVWSVLFFMLAFCFFISYDPR